MGAETPGFAAGATVGVYQIREQIGRGDTGDVYRAWDGARQREIAIKVLPEDLSRDPSSMAGFKRAISVLVDLTHLSIASLYGFEEVGGHRILTMELTEGRVLADRLTEGAIPVEEAVPIIVEVASAIEYSHRHRLVHGHLHPTDVKIDDRGRVKVFDFGLTRIIEALESPSGLGEKATIERPALRRNSAVRGASYQSPEQLRGKVDERTDVWALGVLLWEMLTGISPFQRGSISETSNAVTCDDPDWSQLPEATPAHVRRALQLSLQKRPSMRLRNAGDFVVELSIPFDETSTLVKPIERG